MTHDEELLNRVRRIETRLMRLAEMMGLDPSNKVRATYRKEDNTIEIGGLDVSVANLLDMLRREGISHPVRLAVGGKWVAMFTPIEEPYENLG